MQTGKIEDQQHEALEVDFANRFIGGGALTRGCAQVFFMYQILESMSDGFPTSKTVFISSCYCEDCFGAATLLEIKVLWVDNLNLQAPFQVLNL